jgi:hypothetical protein
VPLFALASTSTSQHRSIRMTKVDRRVELSRCVTTSAFLRLLAVRERSYSRGNDAREPRQTRNLHILPRSEATPWYRIENEADSGGKKTAEILIYVGGGLVLAELDFDFAEVDALLGLAAHWPVSRHHWR